MSEPGVGGSSSDQTVAEADATKIKKDVHS